MASVYDLKPAFQRLLRPMVAALYRMGVTANAVTVAAVVVSAAAGAYLAATGGTRVALLLVPVVLFVRMAMNAVDGMLAREFGQKSKTGALLNELGDVVSDGALYLPFARVAGFEPSLVVAIVLLAALTELAGVLGLTIGATRRYDGPMGKSDRAFVFGLLALLLGVGVPTGPWLLAAQAAILVLLLLTVWNRARRALREASA
jgi:CDP-diacylglycerol--glycerol-3-phosphate 3-phosphatidyltransferase